MVGYAEMREVALWVQTSSEAEVYFEYASLDEPKKRFRTPTANTQKGEAFTATVIADQVQPGTHYEYELFINGHLIKRPYPTQFQTPKNWLYRSDPPEINITLGSCAHVADSMYDRPGKPYSGDFQIFEHMAETKPDLMLWLGDNIYLRESDWYSQTGIHYRYTFNRSLPQMQALLAASSNYAIWDDHDFGPNDSNGSYGRKNLTLEAFKYFWANPSYGIAGQEGIHSMFEWGDATFILLDNRYHRTPNRMKTKEHTVLGEEQLQWLIEALVSSRSRFKFVLIGGQVLNSVPLFENYSRLAPKERAYILNTIVEEGIKNVVFLTGDRHHSELSKYEKNGIAIYDFTVSPLTSGPYDAEDEANTLRVPGSQLGIRNFGTIKVTGPRRERKLLLDLYNSDGEKLWDYEIKAQ